MKFINLDVYKSCEALNIEDDWEELSIKIDEDLKDIIAYYYEKHFNIRYLELGWWLLPGAKQFVKEIENKWLSNTLECNLIYSDPIMIRIVLERYFEENYQEFSRIEKEFQDEIEFRVDCNKDDYYNESTLINQDDSYRYMYTIDIVDKISGFSISSENAIYL